MLRPLLLPSWPLAAFAATCTPIELRGPYAPGGLVHCVGGNLVRSIHDPNSCPEGWKIFAPESREDWETVIASVPSWPKSPRFVVDISKPQSGCSGVCRTVMNSQEQSLWRTSNGRPWYLRNTTYHEPNGDYTADCYLEIYGAANADEVTFNDRRCAVYSRDYFCQPMHPGVNCTGRDEVSGPCRTEAAVFRSVDCAVGVCEHGSLVSFRPDAGVEGCRRLCEEGRNASLAQPPRLEQRAWRVQPLNGFQDGILATTPVDVGSAETVPFSGAVPGTTLTDYVYVRWGGDFTVTTAGTYDFVVAADNGVRVFLDGVEIVRTGYSDKTGSVHLASGKHAFALEFYEQSGGQWLRATVSGPDTGGVAVDISSSHFAPREEREGPFRNQPPCAAYSVAPDGRCLLYSGCTGVGLESSCGAGGLGFLGDLGAFKTCTMP